MDKELEKKLTELLDMVANELKGKVEDVQEKLKKVIKEPCKINIENDGVVIKINIEGMRCSLLMNLAEATKDILKQLKCDDKEYEMIKNIVNTKGVNDNE